MRIELAKLTSSGGSASVLDDHGEGSVAVVILPRTTPQDLCMEAARELREAAEKFELLAAEANPYSAETQDKINGV